MDPLKLSLEDLLYLRLGQFLDQLGDTRVPDLYRVLMDQVDRAVLRQAMERCNGQLSEAAKFLDVDRNTVSRKAKRLKVVTSGTVNIKAKAARRSSASRAR